VSLFRHVDRWVAAIRAPLTVKLQVGFLLVIAVLLTTGVASLLAIASIRNEVNLLERLDSSVHLALGLDHSIVLQKQLSSMLLLTGDEAYNTKLTSEQRRFREILRKLNAEGATAQEFAALDEAFTRYEAATASVRILRSGGHTDRAQEIHITHEHTIAHQIEGLTQPLVARLNGLRQDEQRHIANAQWRTTWTVGAFFLLSIGLALSLGSVLARSILHPVGQVDSALQRIAHGEFVTVADVPNQDELGSLVVNVNRTSHELAELYAKERRTAEALEEQLAALDLTQAQLRQSQKMEAVGRLAGGVAHDFNNLLTVIGGRAALMLHDVPPDHPSRRHVELVKKTADRAAALTQQLLAFSRKQVLQPKVIDLNALVEGIVPMLHRLIGEHIDLITRPARQLGRVKADPTQLEQVVLNLVVNARDAMPHGGTLTIETGNADRSEIVGQDVAVAGPGVTLAVRDTGIGIDPEALPHLFEPFFTTKGPGKGTGLGLATVYGIVNQSGGRITVASERGRGTTVTMWLPLADDPVDPAPLSAGSEESSGGQETILLVEDEGDVRDFAREVLEHYGYRVLEARDGDDALRVAKRLFRAPDLVLTDVVMPKLSGRDLVRQLSERDAELKVLYMSGYTDDALGDHGVLRSGAVLLQKPFTPQELADKVRQVLDGPLLRAGTA
jgi:signal transduction histidine kinase